MIICQKRSVLLFYLGIDYGDVRTGIATSSGIIATGYGTITEVNQDTLVDKIIEISQNVGAEVAVLGLPRNMDGSEGERAIKTREFGEKLSLKGLNVKYIDERMTTMAAKRELHACGKNEKSGKNIIDTVSACLILETYLREVNNERGQ
jgi:putative Holliday junction resolvase